MTVTQNLISTDEATQRVVALNALLRFLDSLVIDDRFARAKVASYKGMFEFCKQNLLQGRGRSMSDVVDEQLGLRTLVEQAYPGMDPINRTAMWRALEGLKGLNEQS